MPEDARPAIEPGAPVHHPKPKHLAERLEGYVGIAMVVAAVVLLGFLAFGLMHTGSGTPSWMR